ncbi:serine hydrolase [Dyadobacter sp. CY343]|uniref:serine hydrolase domain-containing protein n=1 Tax=Dyadobacter sp. CY343 TaxID=2907299 RepID=UPI001F29A964|nr:serine hydrolase domain-containing protein [Dyadobacter sp. CY343]MCE7062201.1 beta-lactamase family protein [Dyadobacter sp. CY343]
MPVDIIHWYGRSHASHQIETAKAKAAHYRTICLSVIGTVENPLYTAVMIKRPTLHYEIQEDRMTATEFSEKIDKMWEQKYGVYLVTATGTVKKPLFAACFKPMTDKPIVRYGILGTGDQMAGLNYHFWHDGYIPVSFDAYGNTFDTQLVAVWHKNTARVTWNVEAASRLRSPDDIQAMFNAITSQGGRPVEISAAPGNRFFELFLDSQVGGWVSRINLTPEAYEKEMTERINQGLIPISVSVQTELLLFTKYSVVFADSERSVARVPRVSVSHNAPKVEGIDNAMLRFMKDHAIRGASLAITQGPRLVYAAGYTYAEPGYPEHKETTLFRQASVSKTFVAAAIYRLIQLGTKLPDGSLFALDTTMQEVLRLKKPDGGEPVDARFGNILVQDLLESCSSIDQDLIWHDLEAVAAFGAALPCNPWQLASYIAGKELGEKDPGSHTNVNYGNTDYFLLSLIITKVSNSVNFEAALKELVLTPLKMTRVRGSRSIQSQQAADEARHHVVNVKPALKAGKYNEWEDMAKSMEVWYSKFSDARPLVPGHYGGLNYELMEGCGGLSAAVTDIARLVAAFSITDEKAVFSETTLETWCRNTFIASRIKSNPNPAASVHGYHGFDYGSLRNPAAPNEYLNNFVSGKGGWLPSHSTSFQFDAGGFGYIVSFNSTGQSDVKTDWLTDHAGVGAGLAPDSIYAISQSHDWKGIDLFPTYGMPSFVTSKFIKFPIGNIDFNKALSPHLELINIQKTESAAMTASMHVRNRKVNIPIISRKK